MKFNRMPSLCLIALLVGSQAMAKPYIFAAGRRIPLVYAIDFNAALRSENNGTPNAIRSRAQVNERRLDGTLMGDPANLIVSPDGKSVYVMNHHGVATTNIEYLQHGGRGAVSVLDAHKAVRRSNDLTAHALVRVFDAGWFGGVGIVQHGDRLVTSFSEGWLSEDGSNRIGILDPSSGSFLGQIEMALVGPGTRQITTGCPDFPVPFVSPTPWPQVPFLSVDPAFGCWPDPEGLAIVKGNDGKNLLISGNAGTEDVSVFDLDAAMGGAKLAELAPRVPMQTGTFGIAASHNQKYVALPARESNRFDFEGNTVTIIDIARMRAGDPSAEVARVQVGVDDPAAGARPHSVQWSSDDKYVYSMNFRVNSVSVIDVAKAIAHDPGAEVMRIPLTRPDGAPARPKQSTMTADGRYLICSGGAKTNPAGPETGSVYIIDTQTNTQVATVMGVGDDPYGVAIADVGDDD